MPFEAKERLPNAAMALERVSRAHNDLDAHDKKRKELVLERAAAITDARAQGIPLRELAELLQVSPERVRQMEAAK